MRKITDISEIESFDDISQIEGQLKRRIMLSESQLKLLGFKWQMTLSPERLIDSLVKETSTYVFQTLTSWFGKLIHSIKPEQEG